MLHNVGKKNSGLPFLSPGVQLGGGCFNSSDCITDRALCQDGICECPKSHVHLRLTENGYDVCREMSKLNYLSNNQSYMTFVEKRNHRCGDFKKQLFI